MSCWEPICNFPVLAVHSQSLHARKECTFLKLSGSAGLGLSVSELRSPRYMCISRMQRRAGQSSVFGIFTGTCGFFWSCCHCCLKNDTCTSRFLLLLQLLRLPPTLVVLDRCKWCGPPFALSKNFPVLLALFVLLLLFFVWLPRSATAPALYQC